MDGILNSFCGKCGKTTTWEKTKNEKYIKCIGCNGLFPCKTSCSHIDCRFERGEVWVCDCNTYRENEEKCPKCGKGKS